MYLDPSRIADLKELDRDLKNATPKERKVINQTRDNIMRLSMNQELGKIRELTTEALRKGDKEAADKLNKKSLEITQGRY